jgi:hypothetical protein
MSKTGSSALFPVSKLGEYTARRTFDTREVRSPAFRGADHFRSKAAALPFYSRRARCRRIFQSRFSSAALELHRIRFALQIFA